VPIAAQESYKSRRVVCKALEHRGKACKTIMRSYVMRAPALRLFLLFLENAVDGERMKNA